MATTATTPRMATIPRQSTIGLILIPSIITLAILILRTVGELQHWSPRFFNTSAGGGGALVGISWLPVIFGIYFAVKLRHSGDPTASPGKALLLLVVGVIITAACGFIARIIGAGNQTAMFLGGIAGLTIAAIIQAFGWRGLFKTLLAYGIAARVPVLIIMFLAIRGHWGTHYDALPPGQERIGQLPLMSQFFDLAVLPQLFFWIPYTILVGVLFGGIVGLFVKPKN